jgi:malonate-semialdehyde dehydrogenase (acetylating) / methylmalonate-semialdehyde dehydrogenase
MTSAVEQKVRLEPRNFVAGSWSTEGAISQIPVLDPALDEEICVLPMSGPDVVRRAVEAAASAYQSWSEQPVSMRLECFTRLRALVEARGDDLAELVTKDQGKTLVESRGEVMRVLENLEAVAAIPRLMATSRFPDLAHGVDGEVMTLPIGVCAAITPFNFPLLCPAVFLAWGLASGNTMILKPSEQDPLAPTLLFELIEEAGFPDGVVNLVHGGREVVDALLDHSDIAAISFIGQTSTARYVFERASSAYKRVQASGGAKNYMVVMPDAPIPETVSAVMTSAFGMAGERCMAGSMLVAVGSAAEEFVPALISAAKELVVGNGLDERTDVGPVISSRSKERIEGFIGGGVSDGATVLLDGRLAEPLDGAGGYFVGPTIFADVEPESPLGCEEVFGPVLSVVTSADLEGALEHANGSRYGNAAVMFTTDGNAARTFAARAQAGNIGINVGVAAPHAALPLGGMKESFFGQLHPQGTDALGFFTDRKAVTTRWW